MPASRGVLIVEDEPELRSLFALLLEMENLIVFQANDGQSGLEALQRHRDSIDLVITDLGLPQLGGIELISRVRSIKPSLKIIGTSGLSGGDMEEMVRAAGADAFIPKPFTPHEAIKKVKEMLQTI
jgi:DNA-binding response OmpR family regulator